MDLNVMTPKVPFAIEGDIHRFQGTLRWTYQYLGSCYSAYTIKVPHQKEIKEKKGGAEGGKEREEGNTKEDFCII